MNQYQQYFETFPFQLALDMSFDRVMKEVYQSIEQNEIRYFYWMGYELWSPMEPEDYLFLVKDSHGNTRREYPFIKIKKRVIISSPNEFIN